LFKINESKRTGSTANKELLILKTRLTVFQNTIFVKGVKFDNTLGIERRDATNLKLLM
jgi:hypothetical protein